MERKTVALFVVFSVSVSVISGMISGWYFSNYLQGKENREIVVLDVARIVEEKKKEFIEKFRDREVNPKMKVEMEREVSSFTDRLNQIIEEESKGRIVLVKDSVISEAKDITDEVSVKVKSPH